MKQARKFVLALALVAMSVTVLPLPSHGAPAAPVATQNASATAPPTEDSWVGVAGAVGCGFGIRVSRATGNPWVIVGTAIMCLIMLADGIRS